MAWQQGPLPANTWNWGGVVLVGASKLGFYFADFHGDHVILNPGTPNAERIEADQVGWFNNAIDMPPVGVGRLDHNAR